MTRADSDPLRITGRQPRTSVMLGGVEIGAASRGINVTVALDARGEMRLTLESDAMPAMPADYLAPVTFTTKSGRRPFRGHVDSAVPTEGRVQVTALGATQLIERDRGTLVAHALDPSETAYLTARASSVRESELDIAGLDALQDELFEVLAPVRGLLVREATKLGPVTLLPRNAIERLVAELGFAAQQGEFEADTYALSIQTESLAFRAEEAGTREIDASLSWAAVRLRHALVRERDGTLRAFQRAERRAVPRRGELIMVRGLATGRRYLRSTSVEAAGGTLELRPDDALMAAIPTTVPVTQRLALAACRRAITEPDELMRVQAMWEAVEFLVAGIAAPSPWTKQQISALKKSLPQDTEPALRARASDALSRLSQVPLMTRLRVLVETRGLSVSDRELDLLSALRKVRNNAAHGRPAETPGVDDVDHATAVVCRLVVETFGVSG